jgi:glycosyltransferase involved in cell wall biosynthesis
VERPALVHHVALKPIVYGTIAARLAKVRAIVNAPVGMGYVFSSPSWKARLIRPSIEFAYSLLMNPQGSCVIFENPDDHELLVSKGMVRQEQSVIIRGAGVDLKRFGVTPDPEGAPVVILPARMLWDKGTGEFAEAARMLKQQGTDARFVLVGDVDLGNLAAVPRAQLENWRDSGIVEWWGHRDDMPKVYAEANIVCLPSYREGLPKTLIEAAASGRPIVATDVPGCREVVRNGDNGLLVCAHDSIALADALRTLIDDRSLRQRMGAAGRKRAEAEFGVERVSAETLRIYEQMLA